MEIRVREVTIRGEKYFIVDSQGITQERQLKLLLEAAYNSIITDPEFLKKAPCNSRELNKSIDNLKKAIEDFQRISDTKSSYRKIG